MKKLFTLCAILFAFTLSTYAQTTGGPDAFGYVWRDSNDPNGPTAGWIDLTTMPNAVDVSNLADDNTVGPFTIGFPFHYYWYDNTLFYIGSNGYLLFNNGQISHPFPNMPSPALPQNVIAPMATDLFFSNAISASCKYWTSPGNDTLVVSWINVPFWSPNAPGYSGDNSFQIILSAVDSSITFQYLVQQGASASTANFVSIGIENNSGNIGLQHSYNIYPPVNYAIKFYYPASTSFQVNDAATLYNDNPETGARFIAKDGSAYSMNTRVANSGNTALNPFNVTSQIRNSSNVVVATSTVQTMALTAGQTQDISHATTFNPTAAGTYTFTTTTQLGALDQTPSNNSKTMELRVVDTTANNILLSYDDGSSEGAGLSWNGGGGGVGIEVVPPFYPCNLNELRAYIVSNATSPGFYFLVFDDSGPNGGPGVLLDSQFVGNVAPPAGGAWYNAILPNQIPITSGSVYVAWMMGGADISIGQDQTAPFSNRTYEILGSTWAIYRYREIEDVMINAYVGSGTTSVEELDANGDMKVYPNPSTVVASVQYMFTRTAETKLEVFDLQGRLIQQHNLGSISAGKGSYNLSVDQLEKGIYVVRLSHGNDVYSDRLVVVK
ncbi:MAG TPA: T9SS type A sorting domain-containing protein [Bacteroidia bacterium]|nr:T9SS type A sorting domain-containing protein [Bacteroidia bacterium]